MAKKYYADSTIIDAGIPSIGMHFSLGTYKNMEMFDTFFDKEVSCSLEKYNGINIKEMGAILGFNELHKAYCKKPRKIKASPETLIQLLKKRGNVVRVSPLVDIYNIISIKHVLALGAHDLALVKGNISLRFTKGNETFFPIGSNEPEAIEANEYCYIDDITNEVLCRMDVRQSDTTKLSDSSNDVMFIIQGNRRTHRNNLFSALDDLSEYVKRFYDISNFEVFDFTEK